MDWIISNETEFMQTVLQRLPTSPPAADHVRKQENPRAQAKEEVVIKAA